MFRAMAGCRFVALPRLRAASTRPCSGVPIASEPSSSPRSCRPPYLTRSNPPFRASKRSMRFEMRCESHGNFVAGTGISRHARDAERRVGDFDRQQRDRSAAAVWSGPPRRRSPEKCRKSCSWKHAYQGQISGVIIAFRDHERDRVVRARDVALVLRSSRGIQQRFGWRMPAASVAETRSPQLPTRVASV